MIQRRYNSSYAKAAVFPRPSSSGSLLVPLSSGRPSVTARHSPQWPTSCAHFCSCPSGATISLAATRRPAIALRYPVAWPPAPPLSATGPASHPLTADEPLFDTSTGLQVGIFDKKVRRDKVGGLISEFRGNASHTLLTFGTGLKKGVKSCPPKNHTFLRLTIS